MLNQPEKRERRRFRRHWLKTPVRITSEGGIIDGFGLRVSDGGMYLFAVADFSLGARVEVEFKSPHSGEASRFPAVIRNRVVYLYGVEFVPEREQYGSRQSTPEAAMSS